MQRPLMRCRLSSIHATSSAFFTVFLYLNQRVGTLLINVSFKIYQKIIKNLLERTPEGA